MAQTDVDRSDEVSYSDYLIACGQLSTCGAALAQCSPDEAAEHWLPRVTQHIAVIFSFVGSNMTARHVPHYARTVAALQAAKDVPAETGTLQPSPQPGGTHGGIADSGSAGESAGESAAGGAGAH